MGNLCQKNIHGKNNIEHNCTTTKVSMNYEKEINFGKNETKPIEQDKYLFDKTKNDVLQRINELNNTQENLNSKENKLNETIEQLKIKENNLNETIEQLKIKENNLNEAIEQLKIKAKELSETEQKLKIKEKELNETNEKLKIKEKKLNEINEKLKTKKIELNVAIEKLKTKEKELDKKAQDVNEKVRKYTINQKTQIDSINQKNKEILEKENSFIKRENILKEKESEFNIKNKELIEYQKQLNQEKIFQENFLMQRENSLNRLESLLEKEKKDFEKIKKKFELSKIPNEIGLQNIGATCYMNATLQALSNTDKFTTYFLTRYKFDQNNKNKKMSNEMYKVLINLWDENKKKGDYPPNDFKNSLSEENSLFAGIQANDSKDLINFLIERFHQEMNLPSPNQININNVNQMNEMETLNAFIKEYFSANKSIITDCFYGIIETKSTCSGCKLTKYNFQIYSFLEFPLKEVNAYMHQCGKREAIVNPDGTNPDIDIYECFDYYQKLDLMTGQNQMYCNICNGNIDTYYGTTVYSLPNYLIINLNRGKGATYKCKVIFPEVLNLLNYVSAKNGNTAMKLYAVICHYGPSSMSGHFIAYCRHRINQKWYKYNDSIVTECTKPNEYYDGMPYILFYQAV